MRYIGEGKPPEHLTKLLMGGGMSSYNPPLSKPGS